MKKLIIGLALLATILSGCATEGTHYQIIIRDQDRKVVEEKSATILYVQDESKIEYYGTDAMRHTESIPFGYSYSINQVKD